MRLEIPDPRKRFIKKLTRACLFQARKLGFDKLREHSRAIIAQRLAPAFPYRDGQQTPYKNHPTFQAQHATGTCCRGCLWKCHRFHRGVRLTNLQQEAIVDLLIRWLKSQLWLQMDVYPRPLPAPPCIAARSDVAVLKRKKPSPATTQQPDIRSFFLPKMVAPAVSPRCQR